MGSIEPDMNLSALNTGLSQTNNPVSTEVNSPGGALSRPAFGTQSGEDFAAFLRQQMASLQSPQRQELATDKAKSPATKGMLAQQALRQAFHPNQYLHAKTPGSKGMGVLNAGGHLAKPLPPARPATDNPSHTVLERHQAAADANESTQHIREADALHKADTEDSKATQRAAEQRDDATSALLAQVLGTSDSQALQAITLSPEVEIITVAESATSEKSLTDFALAMGLDPTQIEALLGKEAAAEATATSAAATTQQILAMNNLPSMGLSNGLIGSAPTLTGSNAPQPLNPVVNNLQGALNAPGTALHLPLAPDVSAMANAEVLPQEMRPIGLEVQWSSASVDLAVKQELNPMVNVSQVAAAVQLAETPDNVSTLAVLSMMDADLRPEDIDRLTQEFDKLSAAADSSPSSEGVSGSSVANQRSSTPANAPSPMQTLKNHPDMAQTFEKLSQKLATELASRMNDQLNAGEWKMKFALKPASLGLVDVQLEMRDGQLSAQFQADNGLTKDLIQNGSTRLKEALAELGMNNAYVSVGQDNRQSSQGGSGQSAQRPATADNHVTLGDDSLGEQETAATPTRHSDSAFFDTFA